MRARTHILWHPCTCANICPKTCIHVHTCACVYDPTTMCMAWGPCAPSVSKEMVLGRRTRCSGSAPARTTGPGPGPGFARLPFDASAHCERDCAGQCRWRCSRSPARGYDVCPHRSGGPRSRREIPGTDVPAHPNRCSLVSLPYLFLLRLSPPSYVSVSFPTTHTLAHTNTHTHTHAPFLSHGPHLLSHSYR